MVAGLAEFLGSALAADAGLTISEVADAFWLAERMEGAPPSASEAGRLATKAAGRDGKPGQPGKDALGAQSGSGELAPVFGPALARPSGPTPPSEPVRVLRDLHRPLNLQRGLRPLIRAVPSGPATVLDEAATAELSARAGVVLPTLVPPDERWLDLALVIDSSPSMALWGNLVRELRVALGQLGAFRSVRTWHLALDGPSPVIRAGTPRSARRPPTELIDPTGRQVTLLVTDCVAWHWWAKSSPAGGMAMGTTLEAWARTGPLAVLQPLPQRMWARTAMAGHSTRLRSPFPGAPNSSLLIDGAAASRRPRTGDYHAEWPHGRRGVAIPILEIEEGWLASWSRLVSECSPERMAVAFTGAPSPDHNLGEVPHPDPLLPEEEQARWLVGQFRSFASPEAFRLAGLLAAAPLSLPMMRLVQHGMCADQGPALLAEVLLSGLLREVTAAGEMTFFAFRPGVRDVLLGTIRRSEAIRVRELVSEELDDGKAADRGGHVARVPGTTGTALVPTSEIYDAIDAKVLRRIGGKYAQVVASEDQGALDAVQAPAPSFTPVVTPAIQKPQPDQGRREAAASLAVDRQETAKSELARQAPADRAQVPAAAAPPADKGVVMLGGPGSGKTTYLAALSMALMQAGDWRLIAMDDPSTEMLTHGVLDLISRRVFPRATDEITSYHWKLAGEVDHVSRAGWRRRVVHRPETVSVDLQITDATGEIFARHRPGRRAILVEQLAHSQGIIFLFDPTREFEYGDTFDYVLQALTMLQQATAHRASDGDKLQHYVAVCLSKFDEDRVFRSADRMRLISYDDNDPYGFPRVTESNARELLRRLCLIAPNETAELAIRKIEDCFRPERIRYFVTSAIGFHLDRRTRRFNSEDCVNYIPDPYESGVNRIRSTVRPINVAEPLIWIGRHLIKPTE